MGKLLIINTSTGWGGLEMNTLKLAKELRALGKEVHICSKKDSRFFSECEKEFAHLLNLTSPKKYFDFKSAKTIASYLKEHQITSILSPFRPDLDVLMWMKKFYHKKVKIIHQQHMQIGAPKKGIIKNLRYQSVDAWLSPLEWLKDEVIEKTAINANVVQVVPIGVDLKAYELPKYSREEARSFFNCSNTTKLLGVIGRIDRKKGQLMLVQALKELNSRGENLHLLIVGSPTINDPEGERYYQELLSYIEINQLNDQITFAPFTNDIQRFYNAIDYFIMSSEGETYGMVTLEAMLSKVPVIGTNSGGTPEILGEGKYGSLYSYNDLNSFISAYHRTVQMQNENQLDLEAIRQHVMNTYSLQLEIEGVLNAINKVEEVG